MTRLQEIARMAERAAVEVVLQTSVSRAEAARRLGVERPQLYKVCARLGIELRKKQGGSWAMHGV